jgi:hypothetical protein
MTTESPPDSTLPNLTGLWWPTIGDKTVHDDRAATQKGYKGGARAVPHGTYTRLHYLTVRTETRDKLANKVLDVFNDRGEFTRFVWNGTDAWDSEKPATGVEFSLATGTRYAPKGASVTRYPTLTLDRYDETTCPSNAKIGGRYVRSVGDGSALLALASQRITYDDEDDTFRWGLDTDPGGSLQFRRVFQQRHGTKAKSESQSFGDKFKGEVRLAQVAFPFYGFDPRRMELFASDPHEMRPGGPGTQGGMFESNPQQSFTGTLIFAFPRADSEDYARAEDTLDVPFLPLGLSGQPAEYKEERTHSETISTVADRARSWSLGVGLSAGVEKMFSVGVGGSLSRKVQEQRESRCRYTFTRRVEETWIAHTDLAQMTLHGEFVAAIRSLTKTLLAGQQPDWDTFVERFGTHYAHAITQGRLDLVETRFSLEAESKAQELHDGVSATTKAAVDASAKGKLDLSFESYKKLKVEMSKEDVSSVSIGHGAPVGILFDLRPITELMSPMFFPYRPLDEWGAVAPLVWHRLRPSLAKYLQDLGLNQPLGNDAYVDYTPRKFKITIATIIVRSPSQQPTTSYGPPTSGVFVDPHRKPTTSVKISAPPAPAPHTDATCFPMETKDWTPWGDPMLYTLANQKVILGRDLTRGAWPNSTEVYWTMAVKGGQMSFPLRIAVTLPIVQYGTPKDITFAFERDVMVEAAEMLDSQGNVTVKRRAEVSESKLGYTLTITFLVEDLGPFT